MASLPLVTVAVTVTVEIHTPELYAVRSVVLPPVISAQGRLAQMSNVRKKFEREYPGFTSITLTIDEE